MPKPITLVLNDEERQLLEQVRQQLGVNTLEQVVELLMMKQLRELTAKLPGSSPYLIWNTESTQRL